MRHPSVHDAARGHRARLLAWSAMLLVLALLAVPLGGCATRPPPVPAVPASELFHDDAFAPASVPIDAARVFALDEAMRAYVRANRPSELRGGFTARDRLLKDLFAPGHLRLDYEASRTRTASEAYEARRGNCLSLVILTGALAREMSISVTYQVVETEEMWSRAGDLYFLNGHVNVVLGHPTGTFLNRLDYETVRVVDFLAPEDQGRRVTHEIGESTVLAMYMNNRAAESLVDGRVDDAYWFAREAVRQDPAFLSAYNTLAVVYLRHGHPEQAAHVLRQVAAVAPDNPRVLGNLAQALRDLGQLAEADRLQARVDRLEPVPPFHWFVEGQLAMAHGEYALAREKFRKELDRSPDYHEFHLWLALADLKLGDTADARRHLAQALENSTKDSDRALYSAKLDRLRAAGVR